MVFDNDNNSKNSKPWNQIDLEMQSNPSLHRLTLTFQHLRNISFKLLCLLNIFLLDDQDASSRFNSWLSSSGFQLPQMLSAVRLGFYVWPLQVVFFEYCLLAPSRAALGGGCGVCGLTLSGQVPDSSVSWVSSGGWAGD